MEEFKIGDKVKGFGLEGVVVSVNESDVYNTLVKFYISEGCYKTDWFTRDGRYKPYHSENSLTLIERAKKKISKRYWLWDLRTYSGVYLKTTHYLDECGKDTKGKQRVDSNCLVRKHGDQFVDVEVEE